MVDIKKSLRDVTEKAKEVGKEAAEKIKEKVK